MNRQPDTVLKTLQLLLRCGMVCREELKIVLETMTASSISKPVPPPRFTPSHSRRAGQSPGQSGEAIQLPAGMMKAQSSQSQFALRLD